MKTVWAGTFLAFSLLVVTSWCNAQPTEQNLPSTDLNDSSPPTEDDQQTDGPEMSPPPDELADKSTEPTEDESPISDDATGKPPKKGAKVPAGKEPSGKGSYSATYQEIGKILDSVDFKSVEDLHLQRMLENTYQAKVRNPIRDQTGQIGNFSAIKACFGKLTGEVEKLINAAKKQFKTCQTGGGNSSGCTDRQENTFADGVINLATTLQGCISSKRKN